MSFSTCSAPTFDSSQMQGLWEDRWITLGVGQAFDAPGRLEHGWRNGSGGAASLLFVTPMRLARFFRDIGRPLAMADPGPPTPADLQRPADVAQAYGHWLGGAADNAAVGISFG
jgi:hypothetical protein